MFDSSDSKHVNVYANASSLTFKLCRSQFTPAFRANIWITEKNAKQMKRKSERSVCVCVLCGLRVQTHHHLLHVAVFFWFSGCIIVLMDNLHSDVIFSRYNPFEIWQKSFWLATVMQATQYPTDMILSIPSQTRECAALTGEQHAGILSLNLAANLKEVTEGLTFTF